MNIRYDDKGKIFTNIITKDPVPAIIQTSDHRIHGQVHARQDERLKDELNREDQFIAVTDAVIYDASGKELFHSSFMAVNRSSIIWLIPEAEVETSEAAGGETT